MNTYNEKLRADFPQMEQGELVEGVPLWGRREKAKVAEDRRRDEGRAQSFLILHVGEMLCVH